jgi:hypothetical protein
LNPAKLTNKKLTNVAIKKQVQLKGWSFEHMNLTTAHTGSDTALIYSVTNHQQTNQPGTMWAQ